MLPHSTSIENSIRYLADEHFKSPTTIQQINPEDVFTKYKNINKAREIEEKYRPERYDIIVFDNVICFIEYFIACHGLDKIKTIDDMLHSIDEIIEKDNNILEEYRDYFRQSIRYKINRSPITERIAYDTFLNIIPTDIGYYEIYINSMRYLGQFIPINTLKRYHSEGDYESYKKMIEDIVSMVEKAYPEKLDDLLKEISGPEMITYNKELKAAIEKEEKESTEEDVRYISRAMDSGPHLSVLFMTGIIFIGVVLVILTAGMWLIYVIVMLIINYRRPDYKNIPNRKTKIWLNAILGPISLITYYIKRGVFIKSN